LLNYILLFLIINGVPSSWIDSIITVKSAESQWAICHHIDLSIKFALCTLWEGLFCKISSQLSLNKNIFITSTALVGFQSSLKILVCSL